MIKCYIAKLNVEPTILDLYDEENLIGSVIPDSLNLIFENCSRSGDIIKYQKKNDIQSILDSELYAQMLLQKEQLIEEFEQVVVRYNETKEIIYREDYMEQRSQLKQTIEELFEMYPFLKNSEKTKIASFSRGKIPEVRMGVTYIDRASKIDKFLNTSSIINRDIVFYYDCSKEWIYIPNSLIYDDDAMPELQSITDEIQEQINLFKNVIDIGKVSINLVYENFSIKPGLYKEITIKRVYPNGDPARDRARAILARAATEKSTLIAPENEPFTNEEIESGTKEDAELGYITSISSRKKNIIKDTIRMIFLDF